MTSMFDYDDSVNMAFDAKIAGKNLVTAKHELLTKTGDFLFMAHSDRELAFRMQMVEEDIERTAHRRLANVSDSKAKLVRAVLEEWTLRHASCQFCKLASDKDPNSNKDVPDYTPKSNANDYHKHYDGSDEPPCTNCGMRGNHYCTGSKGHPNTPNPYNPKKGPNPYSPDKGPNKGPNKDPYRTDPNKPFTPHPNTAPNKQPDNPYKGPNKGQPGIPNPYNPGKGKDRPETNIMPPHPNKRPDNPDKGPNKPPYQK